MNDAANAADDWPARVFAALKEGGVSQIAYVPDAGHARLIAFAREDAAIRDIVLTTEEEGVALAAGAWLGGARACLLLQSSGVGNCINMLTLMQNGRFPLLMLVTMRGEEGEFNPWQVPMSQATAPALRLMDVAVARADNADEVAGIVTASLKAAFDEERAAAVLFSQRLIGAKRW
jgi:sulfopyruvate decarboxylase alpha subunit